MIKVKDLIEMLGKYNPEAVVCVSEKWGRGGKLGNTPAIVGEYTLQHLGYASSKEEEELPAIEISCNY